MRCLMAINLYKITGDELGKLKAQQITPAHIYNWLPKYCIKPDGSIDHTEYWLQFIETGEEVYYLFDIVHTDDPLDYEIAQCGIEEFKFNFNFLKEFPCITYEEMNRRIPTQTHIVFDVNYLGEREDVELFVNVMGYLDKQLELKSIS